MRLAKYLAHAGVASRRGAEQLVRAGRVAVDGETVLDSARAVDDASSVTVDGGPVAREERELHVLNKPAGIVSTARDTHGRPTVTDLVASPRRLYPVGRLDTDTTGLILLTNDGELANRLTHPRYEVEKLYRAEVEPRPVREPALRALREGVELEDGRTAPARVRQTAPGRLEIALREGRNRQVRRMCEVVGHRVVSLRRVAFGPLGLDGLAEGESRRLGAEEAELLRSAAAAAPGDRSGGPRERERALDRAKRYPYAPAATSFVLAGGREYELVAPGGSPADLAHALARDADTGETLRVADLPATELDPEAMAARAPVLAYGANRAPEALARKRAQPGFPAEPAIVVLRARLRDLDVVYSAHISPYGAVGATLAHSSGTTVEVCVALLTEAQLAALGRSEPNYTVEELRDPELELEGGARAACVHAFLSRHGALVVEGSEIALAALPAEGRRFPQRTEPEMLAAVAARLGHGDSLDEFILENVGDPELAADRTRELRRDARPLELRVAP